MEPALTLRHAKEQLTAFLRRIFPEGVDRAIATSPDSNFPALNFALFQPAKKKRSRTDRLTPNADGSWSKARAPGVEDFEEWTIAWELQETCFWMTDTAGEWPDFRPLQAHPTLPHVVSGLLANPGRSG